MSPPVRLHVDPAPTNPIRELDRWVRPLRGSSYWHRPRSAFRIDGRLVVSLWCGQIRHLRSQREERISLRDADPPPGALRCGTCVGRALGVQRRRGLCFRPRDAWAPPTWCFGRADRRERCDACGERVRFRMSPGGSNECRHRPGPGLLERCAPCPRHGWSWAHGRRCDGTGPRAEPCGWRFHRKRRRTR